MRLLADMGVSGTTVKALRAAGHDAVHLRDEGLERLPDPDVLAKARDEDRVVVTFDLDFGEWLAAGRSSTPSAIVLRLRDARPGRVTPVLLDILSTRQGDLESGAIVLVEPGRYRIRRLPIRGASASPDES